MINFINNYLLELNIKPTTTIITIFLLFFLNSTFTKKKSIKIFITNFKQKSGSNFYNYFQQALAKNIKTTLEKSHYIKYANKLTKKTNELINSGFNFFIKGEYKVVNSIIYVDFRVVYLKQRVTIIQAKIKGHPDYRFFNMIEKISKTVSNSINSFTPQNKSKIVSVKIDKKGNVNLSELEINEKNIRKKLIGLWKLVDTSPLYKKYHMNPPGYFTFKKDGSWIYWFTLTANYTPGGESYTLNKGRFGVRGKKFTLKIPSESGGNANIIFYGEKYYTKNHWFKSKAQVKGTLTFVSHTLIELPIIRERFDFPPAGNSYVNMTWRKVKSF